MLFYVIIAFLVVIVILLCGAFIWWYLFNSKPTITKPASSNSIPTTTIKQILSTSMPATVKPILQKDTTVMENDSNDPKAQVEKVLKEYPKLVDKWEFGIQNMIYHIKYVN